MANVSLQRCLDMHLQAGQSAFLWGARKTGKSSYLKQRFPKSVYYDLLKTEDQVRLHKAPHVFREEVQALLEKGPLESPIIVDEIQKVPLLLDEVHWLIENTSAFFILCGSSARKLKRGAANLLGGRAWRYEFFPLTSVEIPSLDLLHVFNHGLLPSHFLMGDAVKKSLDGYIEDYLKEEIQAEGLVRNLRYFARFLDVCGMCNTEMVNFTNIARDCGVDTKTVQNYFQILEDTLLGYLLLPYTRTVKRSVVTATPKFYLFDVGVANRLAKITLESVAGPMAGKSFEHLILMELKAYKKFKERDSNIQYWRTHQGHEVDFVIGEAAMAIEVKLTDNPDKRDLAGLSAFLEEHPGAKAYVVCRVSRPRLMSVGEHTVNVLPYQDFLERLWQGNLEF